jgi:hypothetical protein
MLEMRPNCEICDKDLPADSKAKAKDENQAVICSFECTFCRGCTEIKNKNRDLGPCPNCGGQLVLRPARSDKALQKYPASQRRVHANA